MKPRVVIIGLGLVGGSLARALARRRYRVVGVDKSEAARRAASRSGAFALVTRSLPRALAGADLVVLAALPAANLALLRRVARGATKPPRLIVTDVGSVKRRICELGASLQEVDFVGGHPMAGRQGAGFAASDARLFGGRPWILTPARSRRALRLVRRVVKDAGARPVLLEPGEHDRAVAFVSHLPQLVAWALHDAARRGRLGKPLRSLAGPAFRDMTRIASSPRRLWREILEQNRDELLRALRAFRAALATSM